MPNILSKISYVSIFDLDIEDSLAWMNVENRMLTIKHAYNMLKNSSNPNKWSSFPWDKVSAPAHSMFILEAHAKQNSY